MLTDEQIKAAIADLFSDGYQPEHYDCVRIAYEWLDAQKKTKTARRQWPYKHTVEKWGGRYVGVKDIMIAGYMHPSIIGEYPFNISKRLTLPSSSRLDGIGQARTQYYSMTDDYVRDNYKIIEADQ